MSTERKPGSRGTTTTFQGSPKRSETPFNQATATEGDERSKGSTKRAPKAGVKKRPRK
jgi:hypothetical protein